MAKCELCGEPMPPGEEMFKFHGYSGPCPEKSAERVAYEACVRQHPMGCTCGIAPYLPPALPGDGERQESPYWRRTGMLVAYGGVVHGALRDGATNTGDEMRAELIVQAHNEVVDYLLKSRPGDRERPCGERHDATGAICELPAGHTENHRGAFVHGISQWPGDGERPATCLWTLDDERGPWESGCGLVFEFTDDGPIANGFIFCPRCGQPIGTARPSRAEE